MKHQRKSGPGGLVDYIYIIVGLAGLFFGGEALVRGSVGIARRMAISPLVIGLTVVGFGTSTPELLVSVQAALRGAPDIAIGNVVGSNIANILLILGVTSLIWPVRAEGGTIRRDTAVMVAAGLCLVPFFLSGQVSRIAGAGLVACLFVYLASAFLKPGEDVPGDEVQDSLSPVIGSLLWVAFGLGALLVGADFLVDGAVSVARTLGASEAFIGLTIVAIGTSLPELATSLVAAFRRQSSIALGNVLGSNIFNAFGILGVTALVAPIPVAGRFASFDLPIMIAISALAAALLLLRGRIDRVAGGIMLLAYCVYLIAAQ